MIVSPIINAFIYDCYINDCYINNCYINYCFANYFFTNNNCIYLWLSDQWFFHNKYIYLLTAKHVLKHSDDIIPLDEIKFNENSSIKIKDGYELNSNDY